MWLTKWAWLSIFRMQIVKHPLLDMPLLNPISCTGELVLKRACLSSPQLNTREMDFSSSLIENLVAPCTDKVLPNDIHTELCSIIYILNFIHLLNSSLFQYLVHTQRASVELLVASSINERLHNSCLLDRNWHLHYNI